MAGFRQQIPCSKTLRPGKQEIRPVLQKIRAMLGDSRLLAKVPGRSSFPRSGGSWPESSSPERAKLPATSFNLCRIRAPSSWLAADSPEKKGEGCGAAGWGGLSGLSGLSLSVRSRSLGPRVFVLDRIRSL